MASSIPVSEQYRGDAMENATHETSKHETNKKDEFDLQDIKEMAPKAGVAAIVVLAVVAAGVGFVIYKRRQRRSFMKRLQDAMPEMDEIRASMRRPLERAVKVL
jgi:hypothetical protein